MLVRQWEISVDALLRENGATAHHGVGLPLNGSVNAFLRPDDVPAVGTGYERVVGRMVGHVEGGGPATATLYLDDNGHLRHGLPTLVLAESEAD